MKRLLCLPLMACVYAPWTPTPNSTYDTSYTEQTGNCGSLPDILIDTDLTGELYFPSSIVCQIDQSGRYVSGQKCQTSNPSTGFTCGFDFDMLFTGDASSATGGM